MHTAAGRPGDGRLGVGRKLRQVTPPTQVNKQKPPPVPRRGAGRTAAGGRGCHGRRGWGPAGGRGLAQGARLRAAPTGRGPRSTKSAAGAGPASALTLLVELFFFIIPGGAGAGAAARASFPGRVAEMPPAPPPPLRPPSLWRTRLLCSSGYTKGRPPRRSAHTRTPAPRPSAPSIPAPTRPGPPSARPPGPARPPRAPRARVGGGPAPRESIQRPLTL